MQAADVFIIVIVTIGICVLFFIMRKSFLIHDILLSLYYRYYSIAIYIIYFLFIGIILFLTYTALNVYNELHYIPTFPQRTFKCGN